MLGGGGGGARDAIVPTVSESPIFLATETEKNQRPWRL